MLYIPLTRQAADPNYSTTFYLNVDQALTFARALDDTHTRIRGTSVYTPVAATRTIDPQATLAPGEETVIEVLVLETPEEILALIAAAKSTTTTRGRKTSPMRP